MLHLVSEQTMIPLTVASRRFGLSYGLLWSRVVSRQITGEQVFGHWWVAIADVERLSQRRVAEPQLT